MDETDGQFTYQFCAFPVEYGMRLHMYCHDEIAGHSSGCSQSAFSPDFDLLAVFYSLGDVHGDFPCYFLEARATAVGAGILDDFSVSVASVAGSCYGEESLLKPDLSDSSALGAGGLRCSRFGA